MASPIAHAGVDAPVLWSGRVVTAEGRPVTGAEVSVFARPAARDIQPGTELRHVATTLTGPGGEFVIVAGPSVASGLADAAGWVTMMAVARSGAGVSVALDSVAWQAGDSTLGGRWVTAPATLFDTTDALRLPEPAALVASERPAELRLAGGPDEAPDLPKGPGPKGHPHCVATDRSKYLGTRNVRVGDLHREAQWSGEFVYQDTKSTSFQTGWSRDEKHWGLAGSVSFGNGHGDEDSAESSGWEPAEGHAVYREYLATMEFARYTWRCGEPDWYDVQTVEPFDWTGSLHDPEQGTPAVCDNVHKTWVEDHRNFVRGTRSSQTNSAAFEIMGFHGSTTTATSTATVQKWKNEADHGRDLCGAEDYPKQGRTRVVSLP